MNRETVKAGKMDNRWRPIDYAPKDGKLVVLGWLPNGVLEHEEPSYWDGEGWNGYWTPTHWRRITREERAPKFIYRRYL